MASECKRVFWACANADAILQVFAGQRNCLSFPHPSWSERAPEDWWRAVTEGVPELLVGFDVAQVAGIGSGGQMHGLVALDENDQVIRPAILWWRKSPAAF